MELKQAVEVVGQAINLAVGSGAFKSTQDVAVIHQALGVIAQEVPVETESVGEDPKRKK